MKRLKCCPSGECLNAIAAAIANSIAAGLTDEEIGVISLFFTVVGDALGMIAATRALCESDKEEVTIL